VCGEVGGVEGGICSGFGCFVAEFGQEVVLAA